MIDKRTGEVQFPNWELPLTYKLTRSEFLKSTLGQNAGVEVLNASFASWRIKPSLLYDKWWTVVVQFNEEMLYSLLLAAWDDQGGPRWENWSDANERNLEKYHSNILGQIFGYMPYKFSWGTVESIYDKKSASAYIYIRYNNREE